MNLDPVEIADTLAEIASTTEDPKAAQQLLVLVDRLVTQAGLPPESKGEAPQCG